MTASNLWRRKQRDYKGKGKFVIPDISIVRGVAILSRELKGNRTILEHLTVCVPNCYVNRQLYVLKIEYFHAFQAMYLINK